jgi:hypothetical protein
MSNIIYARNTPHTGMTMWFGPMKFSELWFDGFQQNNIYDTGAIGQKRPSPYLFPMTNEYRNIQYALDDGVSCFPWHHNPFSILHFEEKKLLYMCKHLLSEIVIILWLKLYNIFIIKMYIHCNMKTNVSLLYHMTKRIKIHEI